MIKKIFFFLFLLITLSQFLKAQDFPYGEVTNAEMEMKSYAKDTSAHAVVLQEYGRSRLIIDANDNIKLEFTYHVKIKIFDAKGFDNGTVQIPVYNNSDGDVYESVDDITGITNYKDDNGGLQRIELDDKKIYPVKENKHYANYKFALPGLRNGCVIEYKYRLETPYFYDNFRSWQFQSDIPKIYSEYEVHIPGFWTYNASLRGALKLTKTKAEIEQNCFSTHGSNCGCSFLVYAMGDIPAFIDEDYMTSAKNFMSAVNFELVEYTSPYDGVKKRMSTQWGDVDYQLRNNPDVGGQLKRKGLLKDKVTAIIAGKTDELEKAKAIYSHWQHWFKWNNYTGIYSVDGISKAYDSHSGSVPDINLSLVTALIDAGLKADAVLLSTRENGTVNQLYPVVGDFNYVVARVDIGDKFYLLDATDPLLPFGTLPLKCLNDKGRVFSLDKPSYWMDLSALPQREKSTYLLDVTLQEDGKMKGTLTHYSAGYNAYKKRLAIKKFNSIDEYVENLNSKMPRVKILKSEVNNLDSLNQPIEEKYEVEIDVYNKTNTNKLTFNPFFMDRIVNNPFKLAERSYPVDWGMPSDDRFVLTMHLPANYTIENPPQNLAIALPNNGGKFITSYELADKTFTFSHVVLFNKSVYDSNEYPYLKELYNKIIQSEKAEMVFNKN